MTEVVCDKKLWFRVDHCESLHFIVGNAHTFRGRIRGWCPKKQRTFLLSKSEISQCSTEAEYWIKGFLRGNEPNPPDGGKEGTGAFGTEKFNKWLKKYKEWESATDLFQETSYWSIYKRVCSKCKRKMMPSEIEEICIDCRNK